MPMLAFDLFALPLASMSRRSRGRTRTSCTSDVTGAPARGVALEESGSISMATVARLKPCMNYVGLTVGSGSAESLLDSNGLPNHD
jgi:hypothetical protein